MKHDLNLPPELEAMGERLSATLAAVAATAPVDRDDELSLLPVAQPDTVARTAVAPPRRSLALAAAAAAVIIGAAAAVTGAASRPAINVATGDAAPATSSPYAVEAEYLLPESPPAGFRAASVGRTASPVDATTSVVVYAAGGDPLAERVLAVVRSSERVSLSSILPFEGGIVESIGHREARFAAAGLLKGFDVADDAGGVAVVGRGLSHDELVAATAAVIEDGQATRAVPDGMTLVYDGRYPFIEAPADDVVFSTFATPDGLSGLELRTVTDAAAPVAASVWAVPGERREVSVRGTLAVLATHSDPESGSVYRQLIWTEGRMAVMVGGRGVDDDTMLEFARSLRSVPRTVIDELVERSEAELSED